MIIFSARKTWIPLRKLRSIQATPAYSGLRSLHGSQPGQRLRDFPPLGFDQGQQFLRGTGVGIGFAIGIDRLQIVDRGSYQFTLLSLPSKLSRPFTLISFDGLCQGMLLLNLQVGERGDINFIPFSYTSQLTHNPPIIPSIKNPLYLNEM